MREVVNTRLENIRQFRFSTVTQLVFILHSEASLKKVLNSVYMLCKLYRDKILKHVFQRTSKAILFIV